MNLLKRFVSLPQITTSNLLKTTSSLVKPPTSLTPRTKHIALKYHHFRKWVDSKDIEISYVRGLQPVARLQGADLSGEGVRVVQVGDWCWRGLYSMCTTPRGLFIPLCLARSLPPAPAQESTPYVRLPRSANEFIALHSHRFEPTTT